MCQTVVVAFRFPVYQSITQNGFLRHSSNLSSGFLKYLLKKEQKKKKLEEKKSDIPLETQQSMLIHLSPTVSQNPVVSFSFFFLCLHTIIPLPCNLYKASPPRAVTPQGRVSFALLRGHLFVLIQVFSLCFFLFFFGQGCSMRSG